jgi:peroxiredoxin Q/BCP
MNLSLLALAALVGLALLFSFARAEEAPATEGLEPGAPAPPFRLNDHEGKAVALGGGKGHGWFVLAFYPKASTPGCTKEVCSLRDSLDGLKALGVSVYGISLDDVVSQRKFVEEQRLTFPLLSDPDGSVARKFHVLPEGAAWTKRHTFVVDPAGVVRHVDRAVDVVAHGAALTELLRELVE